MSNVPSSILVMRHAEKSEDANDPNLSPAGYARAERLATFIPEMMGKVDFIFASALSKHSARPYETVKPLAKNTGLPIDTTFADEDYQALAKKLLSGAYAAKRGVVCWHHKMIPFLMSALGASAGEYPDPWDPTVFDLILRVDFVNEKALTVTRTKEPF